MIKNAFISVIPQEVKEENKGSVEFQVLSFANKIRRLAPHLELHKKYFFILERSTENSWEMAAVVGLFVKKIHYKELIGRLDIREPKTS